MVKNSSLGVGSIFFSLTLTPKKWKIPFGKSLKGGFFNLPRFESKLLKIFLFFKDTDKFQGYY